MAQIPKYVLRLLEQRAKAAERLCSISAKLDAYCEKLGICDLDDACLVTHFMIYTEPRTAANRTRAAIEKALEERDHRACS